MEKIHLLMPMGGGGTRFGNKGFNVPKPMIELQGKPFFYWATSCVKQYIDVADITFIILKEHIEKFGIDKEILKYFPDADFRVIDHVLDGAVLTCLEGVKAIKDKNPILFNDCDHAFISREFEAYCRRGVFDDADGGLLTFKSDNPAFSYVSFDKEGRADGTVEKKVVSDKAICGAYYFKDRETFEKASEIYLGDCEYKEFFVSGVYNKLIGLGGTIRTFNVDEHISFGTPDEYDTAMEDKRLMEYIR